MYRFLAITVISLLSNVMFSQEYKEYIQLPVNERTIASAIFFKIRNAETKEFQFSNIIQVEEGCAPCKFTLFYAANYQYHSPIPLLINYDGDFQLFNSSLQQLEIVNSKEQTFYFNLADKRDSIYILHFYSDKSKVATLNSAERNHFLIYMNDEPKLFYQSINKIIESTFGILFIIGLINLISFFINGRKEYLFYALYAFTFFIYFGRGAYFLPESEDSTIFHWIQLRLWIVQSLAYVFYYKFIEAFLDTKSNYPLIHKMLKFGIWYSLISLVLFIILQLSASDEVINGYNDIYRSVIGLYSIALIGSVIPHWRNPLALFMVIGGVILLITSLMSMIFTIKGIYLFDIQPLSWMAIGTLFELLTFSAALAYKFHINTLEKNRYKNSLITEMNKNEILNKQRREDLEKQIAFKSIEIEEEVEKKLKAQFDFTNKNLTMQAMSAQLNPHFIFNSMTSLKRYVLENDTNKAADYIDAFSRLFRQMLENLQSETISLENEIAFISEYVKLENARLGNAIDYKLTYDEQIDLDHIRIPSMVLQPLIENAIWHGLTPSKKENKILQIKIEVVNAFLFIKIIDNGVGLPSTNSQSKREKKRAHSIEINKARINIMYGGEGKLEVRSIIGFDGENQGTEVDFIIPTGNKLSQL